MLIKYFLYRKYFHTSVIGFLNTSNKLSHFTDEEPEAYSGE